MGLQYKNIQVLIRVLQRNRMNRMYVFMNVLYRQRDREIDRDLLQGIGPRDYGDRKDH